MSYFNTLGCGSLGVHFSWNLLSSLHVYILVFYQIWKVWEFFFLRVLFIPSFLLSPWDRPQCVHRCFWWCPTGPLGAVLSSLTFVFFLFFCLSILSSCPWVHLLRPSAQMFLFFSSGFSFIAGCLQLRLFFFFSLVYFHFLESSWAAQLPTTLETPEKSIWKR